MKQFLGWNIEDVDIVPLGNDERVILVNRMDVEEGVGMVGFVTTPNAEVVGLLGGYST